MSSNRSCRETILWLDVAVAARRGAVTASIYRVDVGFDAPSFAVTIDRCWIVGGDGGLSVFDTPQVARRFLQLLGISKVAWKGSGIPPRLPEPLNVRRFYLSRDVLVEATESGQPSTDRSAMNMNDLREGNAVAFVRERPNSVPCLN